jgi:hypothetical protein
VSAIGYVDVEPYLAERAAEAVLADVIAQRARADEEAITAVMAAGRRRFLFWRTPSFTREQAIVHLDRLDTFGWRSGVGWKREAVAKDILSLVKAAAPYARITLSDEGAAVYSKGRELLAVRKAA